MSTPEFVQVPGRCDICGQPATVVRPATANRELAYYCDRDAKQFLGWGDTYHRINPDVCPATGGDHVPTTDTGPLPRWHHGSTLHCDECGASLQPESDPQ
jgi:hypothetical protein